MFFFRLLSYLPFSILYLISDFLSFVAYHVIGYRKKVVFENLRNSFPEKSEKELREIARKFYTNLSDIIVETIKEISISRETVLKRVEVINYEDLMEDIRNDQSVIILAMHQCNWELELLRAGILTGTPTDVVYTPLTNKSMDDFLMRIRSRFGAYPIPIKNTVRQMAKRSKITRMVILLADQTPTPDSDVYWTEFLNQETAFFKGPDVLARFSKYPVYYSEMTRVKRGYYRVNVIPVAKPPYGNETDIIETFIKIGEKAIQENPSDWLWSHRRWKLKRT